MASQSFESDSAGEQASTADDVDSSHQWTTDDLAGESDSASTTAGGIEKTATTTTTGSDSEMEEGNRQEETFRKATASHYHQHHHSHHHHHHHQRRRRVQKSNGGGTAKKDTNGASGEKTQVQSDTETRNLLDDVGDLDDETLDLQEADTLNGSLHSQPSAFSQEPMDPKLFDLSDEQLDYYTKCFLFLMEKTQGSCALNGALNGSEPYVLDFFRKSRLENEVLSRIWALSDTNEDGFLNHSEFIAAMHLIVLHVKARVPIPTRLPSPVRPPLTPVRHLVQGAGSSFSTMADAYSTTTTSASSSTSSGGGGGAPLHNQLVNSVSGGGGDETMKMAMGASSATAGEDEADYGARQGQSQGQGKQLHSLSDDHLHFYAQREMGIANFFDVPPVLVDNHPMAVHVTSTSMTAAAYGPLKGLQLSAGRGPPPKPPQRDYQYQHSGAPDQSTSANKGHGRSASLDLKTFVALSSYPRRSPHHLNSGIHQLIHEQQEGVGTSSGGLLPILSEDLAQLVPPAALAVAPPVAPTQTKSIQTQTEFPAPIGCCHEEMFTAQELAHNVSIQERCRLIRELNEQLENERATLAQIRLQLQLRIEEAQEQVKAKGCSGAAPTNTAPPIHTKPTAL